MANRIWRGNANAIAQVDTITVAGTWLTGETATLTINDKDLVVTVGSATTNADVAEIIRRAFNGDALKGDETRNTTGDQIPEFNEITATDSAAVVSLTADTAGKPFTISVSETSAGGTLTLASSIVGQGPNDISVPSNWSGNAVPVNGDVIFFQESASSALYKLETLSGVTADTNVLQSFEGTIGLPRENVDAGTYVEYRQRFLQTAAGKITVGEGDGTGSGRLQFDSEAVLIVTVLVLNTGSAIEADTPALLWKGTGTAVLVDARAGSVGLGRDVGDTADVFNLRIDAATVVAFDGAILESVTISNGGTLVHTGTWSGIPTITIRGGGQITNTSETPITTLNIEDGLFIHDSASTITTLTIDGAGAIDFANQTTFVTVTNATMHAGASMTDTNGRVTWTNGIQLDGTTLEEVEILDGKTNRNIKLS